MHKRKMTALEKQENATSGEGSEGGDSGRRGGCSENDLEGGARLDQVARVLVGNDDAADGGIAAAAVAAVDQEVGPAAHVVGRRGEELVRVRVALVGEHVAQRVRARGQRAAILDAGVRRVVAAAVVHRPGANAGRVDPGSVVRGAREAMRTDVVRVRAASGSVQFSCDFR